MARRREEDEYYGEDFDREEREERLDPSKREIVDGCDVGAKCDGICRETHGETCKHKYQYYMEPVFKRSSTGKKRIERYRKVETR